MLFTKNACCIYKSYESVDRSIVMKKAGNDIRQLRDCFYDQTT